MSYGIIRVQKFKAGSVRGIQIHDQREKDHSHTNKDINFEKSSMNYDLHNQQHINFYQKAKERIAQLNLKKAVRKDAVVMCQCMITSGHEFFEGMNKQSQDKFFEDAYNFVAEKYGKQNIISATVHFDEKTPHIHINFVPVTSDGRLCAKDLFKKKDLSQLHDDFYMFNQKMGYNLERGENKGEFQQHLSVEEFKIKKQKEELEKQRENLEKSKEYLEKDKEHVLKIRDTLQDEFDASRNALKKFQVLQIIQPDKTLIGGKVKLSEDDYEKLSALAREGIALHALPDKYKKLERDFKDLKNKVDVSIKAKLDNAKEVTRLKDKCNDLIKQYNGLVKTNNEIVDFLEDKSLIRDFHEFRQERLERERQEQQRENSHGWDLQM